MNKRLIISCIATVTVAILVAMPAAADSFTFSTGSPDGLIATLSRGPSPGSLETETTPLCKSCKRPPMRWMQTAAALCEYQQMTKRRRVQVQLPRVFKYHLFSEHPKRRIPGK